MVWFWKYGPLKVVLHFATRSGQNDPFCRPFFDPATFTSGFTLCNQSTQIVTGAMQVESNFRISHLPYLCRGVNTCLEQVNTCLGSFLKLHGHVWYLPGKRNKQKWWGSLHKWKSLFWEILFFCKRHKLPACHAFCNVHMHKSVCTLHCTCRP